MKIAILVPNTCNPDYRVIKQAELFARAGHEVRVFCRHAEGLPAIEQLGGVVYIRKGIFRPLLYARWPQIVWRVVLAFVRPLADQDASSHPKPSSVCRQEHRTIIAELDSMDGGNPQ